MQHRTVCLFVLLILFSVPATAQPSAMVERIDSLVSAYHDAGLYNGAALVGRGDSILYADATGQAHMEWEVSNTLDTRFHVGSVTKQFTAPLILRLVDDGAVALDSTISTYLPDYAGPGADEITIHHLLSHRSGIPSFTSFEDYQSRIMRLEWKPDSLVATFADRDLDFEPGTQYAYSNSGYFLLGVIAQEVTGTHYADALTEKVLAPLGLDGPIGYAFDDELIKREASGYEQTVCGYRPAEPIDSSVPLSAGMLYATPEGLHKWTWALHTGALLPDSLYDEMTAAHSESGYGYGLVSRTDSIGGETVSIVGHGGGINGFTSSLSYSRPGEYTIVVLDNTSGSSTSRIAEGIRQILYEGSIPQPQPSVARTLWEVLQEETVAAATTRYETLRQEQPDAYEYGPTELVRLGDALREKSRPQDAIGIYEYAMSMDSTLAGAYAGLGLAEKTLGRRDAAEAHLRAAVNHNPGQEEAKTALRKMGIEYATSSVELSPDLLEQYTGVYASVQRPDFKITVTREGTQLSAQATGQPKFKIYPSSKSRFYLQVVDAQIEFHRQNNSVPSLTLHQAGRELSFDRVEEDAE